MTDWSDIFYVSITSAALLLSVLGLWFTVAIPGIDRWSERFFVSYFIVFLLCCVSAISEIVFIFLPVPRVVFYLALILESLLLSLPLPMLTDYLLHCCGEDLHSGRLPRAVFILFVTYLIMLLSFPFHSGIVVVTPDNQYYRGPLYPFLLLPMVAILLLNLVGTIRRKNRLSRKVFLSFLVAILPMTFALLVQMFIDVFPLIDISFVLSALSMYGLVLSDQIERDLRRQREIADQQLKIANQQLEIANQRASIMVLQMRPHFIYNTLMSIYSLCNQDPQKARQVTMDFTNYLRKNFNAITSACAIPFSAELEHARAYLAVEQAQFDELLVVDFDTPFTRFRLPPLTLQPLVENAVKHGMDPYSGALHVSVRTRHEDSAAVVTISDDGRGFDTDDDSKGQITLKNIRQRLEIMCGGSLTITPNGSGGTVVTMTIPDDDAG